MDVTGMGGGSEVTGWEGLEVTDWLGLEVTGWEGSEVTGWAGSDTFCDQSNTKDDTTLQWWIQSGAWGAQAPPVMFSVAETC